MSNEMIERVAKEMRSYNPNYGNKNYWISLAKIAIAAMREPTEFMLETTKDSDSLEEGSSPYGCWQTMIDAALKDD